MFSKFQSMWQAMPMQPECNSAAHFAASTMIAKTLIAKTLRGRKVDGGGP